MSFGFQFQRCTESTQLQAATKVILEGTPNATIAAADAQKALWQNLSSSRDDSDGDESNNGAV